MSSPLSSTSWRRSLAGRGSGNRLSDRRPDRWKIRETTKPRPTTTSHESNNEPTSNEPSKRYPFSSLLSSGSHALRARPGRGETSAKSSSGTVATGTASVAASFRGTTTLRNRNFGKGPSDFSSTVPAMAAPTTSIPVVGAVSSDVGSDLLEFGASVEFHEDHRRHIHVETMEIEASNGETREAVAKESRSEEQLRKDLDRARSELSSLNQGAEDQLESANMFVTLAGNLEKEFRSGILEPTRPTPTSTTPMTILESITPPASSHPVTTDGRNQETTNPANEFSSSPNGERLSHPLSNKEMLAKKESHTNEMLRALQNETKALEATLTEVHDLREKQARLDESMKFQGMEESLKRVQEEGRHLESELLQERDTKATRIVEIQQIRESCGAKAQQCTDLTKALAEAKKYNAIEEANLLKQVQTIRGEVDRLLKEKEEVMLQIQVEKRNIEKASKEMEDYHYYCKAKEEYKQGTALRIERKKELLARQAEAKRKLKETQEAEQASILRKQQAEEAMCLAEAKKKANSEMETKIIIPGRAELATLAEQKMKLAEQIGETSKNNEKERAKEREALAAQNRAKQEATEQAEKFETEYKAKQEENEEINQMHQNFIQSHNEQIGSHLALTKKFAEMYEAESEAYETRLKEGRERWTEKLLCHTEDQERIAKALAFKAEIFERGILLLKDAEMAEREANAE